MFYLFFESRHNKAEDPIVLWMSGGPGCSSELALFYENGPFQITDNLTLTWNEHGWDKVCWTYYNSNCVVVLEKDFFTHNVQNVVLARHPVSSLWTSQSEPVLAIVVISVIFDMMREAWVKICITSSRYLGNSIHSLRNAQWICW